GARIRAQRLPYKSVKSVSGTSGSRTIFSSERRSVCREGWTYNIKIIGVAPGSSNSMSKPILISIRTASGDAVRKILPSAILETDFVQSHYCHPESGGCRTRDPTVEVPSPKTQIPGKVSKYPNSNGQHQLL